MGMLISFIVGVVVMAVYQRKQKVPIFRQDVADLTVRELVAQYTEGDSAEERAVSEPALIKTFSWVIGVYSEMRQKLC
jgi:hypothetical protein